MTETDTPEEPRLNRRQAAKLRTADRVLKAARDHFTTVGYEAGTIRAIAKGAGMSTGSIFANYENKAVLYRAAMGHDPITPEQGRAMAMSLMDVAFGEMTAKAILDNAAKAIADMAKAIPGIGDAYELELERRRIEAEQSQETDGIPFREYVKGADGEIVDVTRL